MRNKMQSILSLGLFLGLIFAVQADYTPVINDDGSVVVADFSNPKAWNLRGKGKSNPKINFDSKTPDGKAAITLITQGAGEAVVSTGLIKAGGEWREKDYKQVSFMIKNNGGKGLAFLRFFVPKGNFSILVRFSAKDKDWQKMTINFNKDITKKYKTSNVILCRIRTFNKTNISLGPVMFIPEKDSKEAGAQKKEEKVKRE